MASILKVDQIQLPDGSTPTASDLGIDVSGTIVQAKAFSLSDTPVTVIVDVFTVFDSFDFTTKLENSKILIHYHSGQIQSTSTSNLANPRIGWSVNSTTVHDNLDFVTDHDHSWYRAFTATTDTRLFVTGQVQSDALSKGTHTIRMFVSSYAQAMTFAFQGASRGPKVTVYEIAQ